MACIYNHADFSLIFLFLPPWPLSPYRVNLSAPTFTSHFHLPPSPGPFVSSLVSARNFEIDQYGHIKLEYHPHSQHQFIE